MIKQVVLWVVCVPFVVLAQEAVPAPPASFPWQDNATVVLIVTTTLGILSVLARKIPGTVGKVINWLMDVVSGNIRHDPK